MNNRNTAKGVGKVLILIAFQLLANHKDLQARWFIQNSDFELPACNFNVIDSLHNVFEISSLKLLVSGIQGHSITKPGSSFLGSVDIHLIRVTNEGVGISYDQSERLRKQEAAGLIVRQLRFFSMV